MQMSTKRIVLSGAALIGLAMLACGVVWVIHARSVSARYTCITALKILEGAKASWALDLHKSSNDTPTWNDLAAGTPPYLSCRPECPEGGAYTLGRVRDLPTCSVGGPTHTLP